MGDRLETSIRTISRRPLRLAVREELLLADSTTKLLKARAKCNPAKVGVEGSNPFARSSRLPAKHSPPILRPRKSPTAAVIRATGLGVRFRNDSENLSLNGVLSPKLGAWPIYSTSFSDSYFSHLASFRARKIGIPSVSIFASQLSRIARIGPNPAVQRASGRECMVSRRTPD